MKRPILVSLAAVIVSLGLLSASPAQAAAPSSRPAAAQINPANDPPDLVEVVVVLVDRVTDVLFGHHDHYGHHDHDGDDYDRDWDHDRDRDHSSRCRGVIAVCLG